MTQELNKGKRKKETNINKLFRKENKWLEITIKEIQLTKFKINEF